MCSQSVLASTNQEKYRDLIKLEAEHTTISLAQVISTGSFTSPDGKSYNLPAFCRVHGISEPTEDSEINFEIWMPVHGWNGRYFQFGNGYSGGTID